MSEDKPLNPRQEAFARLYYAGPDELRGNATRCYQKAYPDSSYESAKSNAHRLLTHEGVRARIRELREEAAEAAKARARDWWELYPEAQRTLLQAVRGELEGDGQDKRSAVEAAKEIVTRCEGTAEQVQEGQPPEDDRLEVHVMGPGAIVDGSPPPEDGPGAGEARRRRRLPEDAKN